MKTGQMAAYLTDTTTFIGPIKIPSQTVKCIIKLSGFIIWQEVIDRHVLFNIFYNNLTAHQYLEICQPNF